MDRAWMHDLARFDPMYIENVRHFIEEALMHANRQKKTDIFCPCVDCENKIAWSDSKVVKSHLIRMMVYLMETIMALMMMMILILKSYCVTSNHMC
jgi:hypothetical protein